MPAFTNDEMVKALGLGWVLILVSALLVALSRMFEIVPWDDTLAKWSLILAFGYTVMVFAAVILDAKVKDEASEH